MTIADDWYLLMELALANSRGAFSMSPHWTKWVHGGNIYDGGNELDHVSQLGLHDEAIMLLDFGQHLSCEERTKFRRRVAMHGLNYARLLFHRDGPSSKVLFSMLHAFQGSPTASLYALLQMLRSSFRHHFLANPSVEAQTPMVPEQALRRMPEVE